MPFTLSHPAAILPLRRLLGRNAVLSALVIGSMAPDFPYFVIQGQFRAETHTLLSVLWFSVPTGWLVFLAWRFALRPASLVLIPTAVASRLGPAGPWPAALGVTVSLAVGALTHVLWDGVTHSNGMFVREFPALRAHIVQLFHYPLWSYNVLQHGSTLLGGATVALAASAWYARTAPLHPPPSLNPRVRRIARASLVLVPLTIAIVGASPHFPKDASSVRTSIYLGHIAVRVMGASLAVAFLWGAWLRLVAYGVSSGPGSAASDR